MDKGIKNFKSILLILAYLLFILGLILLIPLLIALAFKENKIILISYLVPGLTSLLIGTIISYIFRNNTIQLNLANSMITVTLAWAISALIGSIPLIISINMSFIDAYFEAISGFTTTGITLITGLESLPLSLIIWRSLMQWLGGLGILTFFLLITFRTEANLWQLFVAESHKISSSRPVPNLYKTIIIFWGIYLLFTIIEIILLVLFKMPVFDAITHSLTSISTGGFSNYDSSIGHYAEINHPYYRQIEYIIIVFMILGGINFLVHFKFLSGEIKEYIKNTEIKYFWKIITGFTLIILLAQFIDNKSILLKFEEHFRTVLFQVVSIMTTTGFGTENATSPFFPAIARQLFLILMLIGGCVGSTSGGFKVVRIAILNRLFIREIKKIFLPRHAVIPVTMDKHIIDNEEIYRVAALFFIWIFLIVIGSGITTIFSDLDAFQAFSGMFSALGNIGPFYFSVEKMASLSPIIKINYIFAMLAGRLEIIPLIALFFPGKRRFF